jgi:hypothetical protein
VIVEYARSTGVAVFVITKKRILAAEFAARHQGTTRLTSPFLIKTDANSLMGFT